MKGNQEVIHMVGKRAFHGSGPFGARFESALPDSSGMVGNEQLDGRCRRMHRQARVASGQAELEPIGKLANSWQIGF
jgi:hypothetical protein